MTLFETIGDNPVFGFVLETFYGGEMDEITLRLLATEDGGLN